MPCPDRRPPLVAALLSIAALAATAIGEEPDLQALDAEWHRYYNAHDWKKAIDVSHKLIEADPGSFLFPYNLACVYALSNEPAKALEWLEKSADKGFDNDALFDSDPDLETLRKDPKFESLRAKVRKTADARFDEFRKQAEKAVVRTVVPENLDRTKPAPLIVALHGFGGDADDIVNVWKTPAAAAGAILIAPQALTPAGAGWQWGAAKPSNYLVTQAVEKALKEHKINAKRIVITGFSQGGSVASMVGVRQPERFCGVIPVAGGYDVDRAMAELGVSTGAKMPKYFIMVGEADPAIAQVQTMVDALKAREVPHELHKYPGVGHTFPPDRDGEIAKALAFVLSD